MIVLFCWSVGLLLCSFCCSTGRWVQGVLDCPFRWCLLVWGCLSAGSSYPIGPLVCWSGGFNGFAGYTSMMDQMVTCWYVGTLEGIQHSTSADGIVPLHIPPLSKAGKIFISIIIQGRIKGLLCVLLAKVLVLLCCGCYTTSLEGGPIAVYCGIIQGVSIQYTTVHKSPYAFRA